MKKFIRVYFHTFVWLQMFFCILDLYLYFHGMKERQNLIVDGALLLVGLYYWKDCVKEEARLKT
jgi:hypothetical protein